MNNPQILPTGVKTHYNMFEIADVMSDFGNRENLCAARELRFTGGERGVTFLISLEDDLYAVSLIDQMGQEFISDQRHDCIEDAWEEVLDRTAADISELVLVKLNALGAVMEGHQLDGTAEGSIAIPNERINERIKELTKMIRRDIPDLHPKA